MIMGSIPGSCNVKSHIIQFSGREVTSQVQINQKEWNINIIWHEYPTSCHPAVYSKVQQCLIWWLEKISFCCMLMPVPVIKIMWLKFGSVKCGYFIVFYLSVLPLSSRLLFFIFKHQNATPTDKTFPNQNQIKIDSNWFFEEFFRKGISLHAAKLN